MFISPAFAQSAETGQQPGVFAQMLPLVLIVVLFYFLLIRPQQKRAKEHKQILSQLAVGDEVMTNAGIMGKITEVNEQVVTLNLGTTQVKFQKQSIQSVLPQGTLDADSPASDNKKSSKKSDGNAGASNKKSQKKLGGVSAESDKKSTEESADNPAADTNADTDATSPAPDKKP